MLKSKANWQFRKEKETSMTIDDDEIIEQLFTVRGLVDQEERERFLQPELAHLQSPAKLAHIERLKERIEQAIEETERVIVYGDYDADGVTATTLLVKALRALGVNCEYYIPNRFTEGYGINDKAIELFAEENVGLMITVDTGIANVAEVSYANDLGIDVIITDHHEVQEQLPEAYAIIHPILSPDYNFKLLAGVGIAWQIAHYLLGEKAHEMLDLAAIGTVADLVPLVGENRVLVAEGLKRIAQTKIVGLEKLIETSGIQGEITERDIAFMIGPRLNAVGRLQNATLAVQLLLSEDEEEAQELSEQIETLNKERQQIVQAMAKEADARVDKDDAFIVLADENWHEGVLGIAASRLVNTYHRPVMLLTMNEDGTEWKGSARSVPGFNLFEACMAHKELFSNFGGHSQAAGMSLPLEHLTELTVSLNKTMEAIFEGRIGEQQLFIEHAITLEQMTETFIDQIEQFAPFGMENEQPLFHLEAVPTQIRRIGKDDRHLKLQFRNGDQIVEAIGFGFGKYAPYIARDSAVSLVGELQLNEWNGRVTVQMNIEDMAVNEWQIFDFRGKQHLSNVIPYIHHYDKNILVCNDIDSVKEITHFDHVDVITFDTELDLLKETEVLYIYDLPKELNQLTNILHKTKPKSIHVAYNVENGGLLHTRPNREQFKQVYIYLATFEQVPLKQHYPAMMKQADVRKEQLSFILKVFYDLNFIAVENNVVTLNRDAPKTALTRSETYQKRIEQEEVEALLYYSSLDELKQWLQQQIDKKQEEELSHGL